MKIAGIVCEFNPFHYGHKYIIDKIKNDYNMDLIIASMSPNFVMRGAPSIINKFDRCAIALDNNIDIVAEIPTIYTIESADIYAYRSIEILNNLKITDLFFGAEDDDINKFNKISDLFDDDRYKNKVKEYLDEGLSFKISSKKAILDIYDDYSDFIESPNNLLGIHYINSINKINPNIKVHVIKRVDSYYYDPIKNDSLIQSASAIRESIFNNTFNNKYLPYNISNYKLVNSDDCFEYIKYKLLSLDKEYIKNIQGVNEGFENNLKSIKNVNSYDELVNSLLSKRNRETKINRILICLLLDIKKDEINNEPLKYVRVLGFNNSGREYLKLFRDSIIPIYTYIGKNQEKELYRELDFTKIYELISKDNILSLEYKPILKI